MSVPSIEADEASLLWLSGHAGNNCLSFPGQHKGFLPTPAADVPSENFLFWWTHSHTSASTTKARKK